MEVFNEQELRKEIVKTWGAYGVHVEVFDEMAKPKKQHFKDYCIGVLLALSAFFFVGILLYSADNERLNAEINVYRDKLWNESFAHGATKGEVERLKDDYKYLQKRLK